MAACTISVGASTDRPAYRLLMLAQVIAAACRIPRRPKQSAPASLPPNLREGGPIKKEGQGYMAAFKIKVGIDHRSPMRSARDARSVAVGSNGNAPVSRPMPTRALEHGQRCVLCAPVAECPGLNFFEQPVHGRRHAGHGGGGGRWRRPPARIQQSAPTESSLARGTSALHH